MKKVLSRNLRRAQRSQRTLRRINVMQQMLMLIRKVLQRRKKTARNILYPSIFKYLPLLYSTVLYCTVLYCTVLYCFSILIPSSLLIALYYHLLNVNRQFSLKVPQQVNGYDCGVYVQLFAKYVMDEWPSSTQADHKNRWLLIFLNSIKLILQHRLYFHLGIYL